MWRETNLGGVYLPPLLAYATVALLVSVVMRAVMIRLRLFRWTWNPPLAETALFVCILAVLLRFA